MSEKTPEELLQKRWNPDKQIVKEHWRKKKIKPFISGDCHVCGYNHDDFLVPVTIRICKKCVFKVRDRLGFIKIISELKTVTKSIDCDLCLYRTHKFCMINPHICERCMRKLGNKKKRMAW